MSFLSGKVDDLNARLDRQEQYSRRNCLLIHGIEENQNENTDALALEIINKKLELDMDEKDVDRTHRIGDKNKKKNKPRPIIIKFVRYNDRKKVFYNKKKLKDSGVSITESLTKFRMDKLGKAREEHGFKHVWTVDGRICYLEQGSQHPKTYYN